MMDYGKIAEEYDSHYTSAACKQENQAIKTLIDGFVDTYGGDISILDVGCGTGFALDLIPYIQTTGYVGVDVSDDMLDVARKKHPRHRFHKVKAENIFPYVTKPNSVDLALCLFSIPYIGERSAKAIYEALKPGGYVLCVCYDKPYLNPSSVYGGHKWRYVFTVKPKVRRVLASFNRQFGRGFEFPLTGEQAYKVVLYKKGW